MPCCLEIEDFPPSANVVSAIRECFHNTAFVNVREKKVQIVSGTKTEMCATVGFKDHATASEEINKGVPRFFQRISKRYYHPLVRISRTCTCEEPSICTAAGQLHLQPSEPLYSFSDLGNIEPSFEAPLPPGMGGMSAPYNPPPGRSDTTVHPSMPVYSYPTDVQPGSAVILPPAAKQLMIGAFPAPVIESYPGIPVQPGVNNYGVLGIVPETHVLPTSTERQPGDGLLGEAPRVFPGSSVYVPPIGTGVAPGPDQYGWYTITPNPTRNTIPPAAVQPNPTGGTSVRYPSTNKNPFKANQLPYNRRYRSK